MKQLLTFTQQKVFLLLFAITFSQLSFGQQGCPNLVTNGDFSQGDAGFTSSFVSSCTSTTNCKTNSYCVTANFQTKCNLWPNSGSTAPSTGNFMAVDGFTSGTAPFNIWKQTSIPVTLGQTYTFSFWVKSIHSTTVPGQNFNVDMVITPSSGSAVILSNPITSTLWIKYTKTWVSTLTGTVDLALIQPVVDDFYDFGLDDISFNCACLAAFTATPINNCGLYQITNTSVGTQPISYQWCNGQTTPSLGNVQLNCGKNDYCLTMTAADGCISTVTQSINFTETIPPLITNCPQNTTVNTNQGKCDYTIPTPWTISATDNCDPNPTIALTYTSPSGATSSTIPLVLPKGINTFVYQAKDKCGNLSKQCAFTITVVDNEKPSIICPQNVTIQGVSTPPPSICKATVNNIAPISSNDNCPMSLVTYTITGATTANGSGNASGTMFMEGVSTVTYTITDMAGNTSICSFTVTVFCDVCPNNFARNGSFSQGTPNGIDQSIGLATGWSGIWTGGSIGDFWNTTTATPTAAFPTLVTPMPTSAGNFGGFWNRYLPGNVIYREGIMNKLATPINKNTDCYEVAMNIACMTNVSGVPFLSVYGVPTGSTPTSTPIAGGTPLNADLFGIGTNKAILLGTYYIPSTCDKNFQPISFKFSTNTWTTTQIDRVFFTRSDARGGGVYLAVDDVCIQKTPCEKCQCSPTNPTTTVYYTANGVVPIACNNTTPVVIPCKKLGPNFFIHGDFPCASQSCGQNVIYWEMTRPTGQTTLTGVIPVGFVNGPDHFDLNLLWSEFSTNGNYSLKFTRYCGEKPCVCVYNFKVDCPCDCTKLNADALKGFVLTGSSTSCSRLLTPTALCSNDKVTWNILTVSGTPFTQSASSVGNAPVTINFPSPGGVYNVCVLVVRYDAANKICAEYKYCKKIVVKCNILPNNPNIPYVNICPKTMLKNGDFAESTSGILGENASIKDWELFKNVGNGVVFVNNDAGAFDDGEVTLFGGKDNFAGISQKIDVTSDNFTTIRCEIKNLQNDNTPAGTVLDVRLQESLAAGSKFQALHKFKIQNDTIGDFKSFGFTFDGKIDPAMKYIIFCVQSSDDKLKSMITIDNIEVCTSPNMIGVNDEAKRDKMLSLRIFPNPNAGSFIAELPIIATSKMTLRITDLAGRVIMEKQAEIGTQLQNVASETLPNGLYFLQIVAEGKTIAVEKFVKQ